MAIKFNTIIRQDEGKNTTGIVVPPEVIEELGTSKKPPVKLTINSYTYTSTVAVRGNEFMVSLSAENRAAAGVKGGDQVEVTIELDAEPRTIEIPADLAAALAAKRGAMAMFEGLAFSKRKEFVRQVEDAKTPETRERRISGIVAKLGDA